jgi:hypothetical protein
MKASKKVIPGRGYEPKVKGTNLFPNNQYII